MPVPYPLHTLEKLNKTLTEKFPHLCPIQPHFNLTLSGISRLVMLDRYSQKDKALKTLQIGDIVITTIKHDSYFSSRGIGTVIMLEIEEEFESKQIAERVGRAIAKPEKDNDLRVKYGSEFEKQIRDFKIIPAGRILHGAGSGSNVTFFNCYVMPYIKDSTTKIIGEHFAQVAEIMRRGGGVGSNGSTLRPKGAICKDVGGKSSGAVSWLNYLSELTHLIEQGGSRRGAQMIITGDELIKKEISNKLEKKEGGWKVKNPNLLTGTNISVWYNQKIVATNPCGEQPLPPYSVCNLSAINLASFVNKESSEILWDELKKTVSLCIRFQDNIIDTTYYFLKKNTEQAQGERRIGMGVMGLHDFLIYRGLRYGSAEANLLVDKLFETICLTAYKTSVELAQEKGVFPFLKNKNELVDKSGFIRTLPQEIQEKIRERGLRNSHLLTVAPTGSTGTLVGVSTGLEPYFAFSYYRSGRLGKFIKTINAPKGYKVEQVKKIYETLYEKGAKGGTVYVDGCRDLQVLSLEKEENKFSDLETEKEKCK
ncbi:12952_t:CDS:2, partial [Funneliformis geosporum]